MGCHFCQDELFGFMAVLAVFRFIPTYVRAAWGARHKKPACKHDHEHVHEDQIVADEPAGEE